LHGIFQLVSEKQETAGKVIFLLSYEGHSIFLSDIASLFLRKVFREKLNVPLAANFKIVQALKDTFFAE